MTLAVNYSWLYANPDGSYEIAMRTSNQFDKLSFLYLGDNKESAMLTLKDLLSLIENKVSSTNVQQGKETITIMYLGGISGNSLQIKADGKAGYSTLMKSNIEKMLKYFEQDKTYNIMNADFENAMSDASINGMDDPSTEYQQLKELLKTTQRELNNAKYNSYGVDNNLLRIKEEQVQKIKSRMQELEQIMKAE